MATDKNRARFWRELIERHRASGQTAVQFCKKAGVSTASLYTWKRRLNAEVATTGKKTHPDRQRGEKEPAAQMASLVPVQVVADPSESDAAVEVHLPGAVMLRVAAGCEEQTLRVVLAALAKQALGGATRC
jgi:transposase-like protein